MDIGVATDIVVKIQNGGKKLIAPMDGKEILDYAAEELLTAFSDDEDYDQYDIDMAISRYLTDKDYTILTGKQFRDALGKVGATPLPISKAKQDVAAVRRRTNGRMWKSFARCMKAGLKEDFHKYLPDEATATNFATAHGFQVNEMQIPLWDGGQLLAIMQFYGEYKFMKSKGLPFPWKLQKQGNEAVLIPIR